MSVRNARTATKLIKWLKVNQLLQETKQNVLHKCLMEIGTFYGIKQLLMLITKAAAANANELQSLDEIVRKQKIKYQNKTLSKSIATNTQIINNKKSQMKWKQSAFYKLPDECISHICGYLRKKDIKKSLKQTCRQIAIVCLQEMQKITVSTYNIKKLRTDDIMLYHWCVRNDSQQTRHHPNKKYFSLFEEWSAEYNVPERNLMIFEASTRRRFTERHSIYFSTDFRLLNCANIRLTKIAKVVRSNKHYLICDNRDITMMDKGNARLFDADIDTYEEIKDDGLFIMEYFDVFKQTIHVIQFGLYKTETISTNDVFYYIQRLCLDLNATIHKMHNYDSDVERLQLFVHSSHNRMKVMKSNEKIKHHLYTFQLNCSHPFVVTTKPFQQIKRKCDENLDVFYRESAKFSSAIKTIPVRILNDKNELKLAIKRFYESELNQEERMAFVYDLNRIGDVINKSKIKIKMDISSKSSKLRMKISKLLGNIIHPKNIELYRLSKDDLCNLSVGPIPWNKTIGAGHRVSGLQCKFVIDDIANFQDVRASWGTLLYSFKIFLPKHCPHPFYFGDEISKTVSVRYYRDKFQFKQLIQHLFQTIYASKSKNNIFRKDYETELKLFYGENFDHNYTENSVPSINDEIDCIISTKPEKNVKTNDFSVYDTSPKQFYRSVKGRTFDLFLLRSKPNAVSEKMRFKLRIKFICLQTKNPELNEKTDINILNTLFKFDGIPLVAWICEQDSIEAVMNEYFKRTKKFIQCCFRVNINGEKLQKISHITYAQYRPYYEFIAGYPNDYLIFVFAKCEYSLYIHRPTALLKDRYYFIVQNALLKYKDQFVIIAGINRESNTCSIIHFFQQNNVSLCTFNQSNKINVSLSEITHVFDPSISPEANKTIQVVHGKMKSKIGTYIKHLGSSHCGKILVNIPEQRQNVTCDSAHVVVVIK